MQYLLKEQVCHVINEHLQNCNHQNVKFVQCNKIIVIIVLLAALCLSSGCCVSYSTALLYVGNMKVWGFLPKNPTYKPAKYLLCESITALVRHSQAQKMSSDQC